ncbi:hypothetical protein PtrEW13061_010684 [Pyrenophora tritici-repentis]|nr:hypothetical protein PtrEW13061_010684 [Pyrenophora tritici-repentis]
MHIDDLFTSLDLLGQQVRTTNLHSKDLQKLKENTAQLTHQLEALQELAKTAELLKSAESDQEGNAKRFAPSKSRMQKMIKAVYNTGTEPAPERLTSLSRMNIETFLFLAASYTPLGITRLDQNTFDCLVEIAPLYVRSWLPPGWLHRTEFQLAVTAGAGKGSEFKRKYQELEYGEAPKRLCKEISEGPIHKPDIDPKPRNDSLHLGSSKGIPPKQVESGIITSAGTKINGSKNHGIETAFEVPREVFEVIWENHTLGDIIMTIPTEDRVSSILHTIPREDAIEMGERYSLRKLPLPTSV